MFYQENQFLLTIGSSKSTSVSMIKPNRITSTSIFLQGLFLQYLHKAKTNFVSIQSSLPVSLHDDILHHFYEGISMVVSLLSSLLSSLRSELLQTSLPASLRSKILQSSLRTYLQNKFLQLYLLVTLRSGVMRSSLLASLQSKFLQSSLLASLWNIILRRLYKDIPTVTPILSKLEIFIQGVHSK